MTQPFVVESLDEVEPKPGAWVYVRGKTPGLYVARDGQWIRHEKAPDPDLWTYLTADDEA